MSGVVVEVRVKEGHEIKKGDPLCGKVLSVQQRLRADNHLLRIISSERNEGEDFPYGGRCVLTIEFRWNLSLLLRCPDMLKECSFKKVSHSVVLLVLCF